ncbi:potassium channel family protein [Streptomyces neyagawaensis]|uniref:potassium channel family protein n=1 Tax=Streptomyces neyagawaensis TaxID=42238 RepID=UPI0006E291B6|nr:potassium channel family protein [Streptomyces neyagawaensis]MCL6735151.1 potassium channel family protein [Streptomyces neyagawaensis]MDE1687546.1 potassium channel family protein [Streptomyces neyagawaensis]
MKWLVSLVGAGLVMLTLRDLFHTLWHPTRHGGLSRLVMTALWRLARRFRARRRVVGLVGPLAMVTVVGMWAATVVLGWAIVYWPHMPGAFAFSPGSEAAQEPALLDSVYLSLVTVATLGLGDIAPGEGWLRLVSPLEALVGFALLTATVSWVLEIYPALTRRRVLAVRLALLRDSAPTPQQIDCTAGALLLDGLATEVVRVRIDFTQYAEAYYFHDGEDHASLAATVGYAATMAQRGGEARRPEVRLAGDVLAGALKDLAAVLDQRFLHTGGTATEVFAAYAADHGRSLAQP